MAKGHTTIHAARSLQTAVTCIESLFYLTKVCHTFVYGAITCFAARNS